MPMAIDFARRLSSFGSGRYKELREAQAAALANYGEHVDTRDVAIELPTGYGKTLVALLIADFVLERGMTVAYLAGTNQLVDQVIEQANDLPGLDIVRFSSKRYPPASLAKYHGAKAVGIMNYWTYFNTSPKVEAADLVIFDDAHLAEQPLAGLFAVRIDRDESPLVYQQLCDLVLAHTDLYPSIELMREGSAGPSTPPELLAFSHWSAIADSATDVLSRGLPSEMRTFVWPRVRPHISACGVLIGPTAIEIRPYNPPTQTLPGYSHARQRLYLSATLGTMDDLQRRLGVAPVVNVVEPTLAVGEVGERVFILNPSDEAPLDDRPAAFALRQAVVVGRAAWLCASHNEADQVELLVKQAGRKPYRLRSGGDDDVLDRWAADPQGHLVTAGRYDGLDFAGDVCRLVILPSVPAASTEFERFVMAYLSDATFMRHRVGQRVTQALGRANRRQGDWAMYLGLAPGFGTLLAQSGVQAAIPAGVRPTIDAALARAGEGWRAAEDGATEFWKTRQSPEIPVVWAPQRTRPGRSRPAATAGSASEEVAAVTSLWLGDPHQAAEAAGRAAATLSAAGESEHAAFWWYVQAQANFLEGTPGSTGRAIDALRAATEGGAATTWFVRLNRVLAELRGQRAAVHNESPWLVWDDWIRESGTDGVRRAIERCRARASGTHDQQAESIEGLARIAGIAAHRPKGQSVTDVVWNWASGRRIERRLWEVKTGDADSLPRSWIDQALGQLASEQQSAKLRVVACVATSLDTVDISAKAAARNLCLVHVDAIRALIDVMSDRLLDYVTRWGEGSTMERGSARSEVERRLPSGSWLEDLFAPSDGRLIRREDVLLRFPNT
jgi:hypothetical protein